MEGIKFTLSSDIFGVIDKSVPNPIYMDSNRVKNYISIYYVYLTFVYIWSDVFFKIFVIKVLTSKNSYPFHTFPIISC